MNIRLVKTDSSTPDAPAAPVLPETDLINAATKGDAGATRKLLQLAISRIRKTARYLCVNDAERDDLVQNTLIEVVRSLPGFKGDSTFFYWLDRITVFTASKHIDKAVRRRKIEDQTWFPATEQISLETSLDQERLRNRFRVLLGEIKPAYRSPVVLHYLHGYTVDEIADLMQIKRNTIRGRLRTGLRQIRSKVQTDDLLVQWTGKN